MLKSELIGLPPSALKAALWLLTLGHGEVEIPDHLTTGMTMLIRRNLVRVEDEPAQPALIPTPPPACPDCGLVKGPKNLYGDCAWCAFREAWNRLGGKQITPRNLTARDKFVTRWKEAEFHVGYREALSVALANRALLNQGWFTAEFFLRNATNWRKVRDGVYDWMMDRAGAPSPDNLGALEVE